MDKATCQCLQRARPLEQRCDRSGRPKRMSDRRCPIGAVREILASVTNTAHLVHGPLGCALSSQAENDFDAPGGARPTVRQYSSSLGESDIIFGGERKLEGSLRALIRRAPDAIFVYATCVAALIGDDMEAIAKKVGRECGIPIVTIDCKGYKPSNHTRLAAPCEALWALIGDERPARGPGSRINILGHYGSDRRIEGYFHCMGIDKAVAITGASTVAEIAATPTASLNLVQRSRPMAHFARRLSEVYEVPSIDVSFFGIDETAQALRQTAIFLGDPSVARAAEDLIEAETAGVGPRLAVYRRQFEGARAVINPGGPYQAVALVRALRSLGIEPVAVNMRAVQTSERQQIDAEGLTDCVLMEDATSNELSDMAITLGADLVIGEIADGLVCSRSAVAFCLHSPRTMPARSGFAGMLRFAEDLGAALFSPVRRLCRTRIEEAA